METKGLDDLLREHFGFESFRPGQRTLIEAVLSGRDAFGVLPTAGGKSLCYQLPALMLPGLTVVVSPLIALMKDQVDAFNRRSLHRAGSRCPRASPPRQLAVTLHSNLSGPETSVALANLERGEAALLYVAPERLEAAEFRERLLALKPRLLVVDEVHCVSMWGHDFRPSYLCLAEVAASLRPAPVLALTATATPETRRDILARLGLQDPLVQVAPFDRPNLRFEVHPCGAGEKPRRLRRILRGLAGAGSQIVYVGRRKDAEEIAADLEDDGFGAVAYHAGMQAAERKAAQEAWLAGEKQIAVATIAFGMGIDKPDVRAVIHHQHPASLEAYYQEAGRAGRDGLPARCILLFSSKDSSLAHFFIRNRYPTRDQVLALAKDIPPGGTRPEDVKFLGDPDMSDEQRNVALLELQTEKWICRDEEGDLRRGPHHGHSLSLERMFLRKDRDYRRLEAVVSYANEARCHRSVILEYFGEEVPAGHRCGNCSACEGGTAEVARAAVEDEVERVLRHRWGLLASHRLLNGTGVARFLAGSSSRKIPPLLRELPEFGSLSNLKVRRLRRLAELALDRIAAEGAAAEDGPAPAAVAPTRGEVFWSSQHRSFTRERLIAREVARPTGLLILGLLEKVTDGFAPSRIVSLLRGKGEAAEALRGEEEPGASLPQSGSLAKARYEDLLEDVLAMWAKGYLSLAAGSTRRLVLSKAGREALGARPRSPAGN